MSGGAVWNKTEVAIYRATPSSLNPAAPYWFPDETQTLKHNKVVSPSTTAKEAQVQRVLILGANGFVGSRLVAALFRSGWATPIAAVRARAAKRVPWRDVEVRVWNSADPTSLAAALQDVDFVVNCVLGDSASIVGTAQHLFAAARKFPIERVVHMSSMAVYGASTGIVDETAPFDGSTGWYATAKIRAERFAMDFSLQGGSVVVLRPSCIYGPGSYPWTRRIARLLRAGRIGDLGPLGDGLCNLIYIDDVIGAILHSLQRPNVAGEAFNVSNARVETWNRYFARLAAAIGAGPIRRISARRLKLDTMVAAMPLKALELIFHYVGFAVSDIPDPIPPSLVRIWRQDIQLDHHKSDALLGFARTPLDHGIAASARWLGS
jgi:nucleoside-diphosphate-sugar epimerase